MEIIDLTHLITNDMPVYPGTEKPKSEDIFTINNDGFLEHKLTLFSHTGTHIDAPAHMLKGACTLDQLDINQFCGSAFVLDCTHKKDRRICIDDMIRFEEELSTNDFVILNTGWSQNWGKKKYYNDYPGLTPEAASWLSGFNLKGIGIDTISIDLPEEKDFIIHKILLETGIIIIENLTNLNLLQKDDFILSCLPLKFENSDGSPVRAIAIKTPNR